MTSCVTRWTPPRCVTVVFFVSLVNHSTCSALSSVGSSIRMESCINHVCVWSRVDKHTHTHTITDDTVQRLLFCRRRVLEDAMSSNPRPIWVYIDESNANTNNAGRSTWTLTERAWTETVTETVLYDSGTTAPGIQKFSTDGIDKRRNNLCWSWNTSTQTWSNLIRFVLERFTSTVLIGRANWLWCPQWVMWAKLDFGEGLAVPGEQSTHCIVCFREHIRCVQLDLSPFWHLCSASSSDTKG